LKLDRYTWAVLKLIKRRYAEWDVDPPTAAHIARPTQKRLLKRFETVHGVKVPVEDEDWPTRSFAEKAIHALFRSPFYSVWDDPQQWESAQHATTRLREVLGDRLIPGENAHWDELQSDHAQSLFAFRGLAALYLTTTDEPDADWVVDMTWLYKYDVRPGYERYGAAAFFDADRNIVRIRWSQGGVVLKPGDDGWEHAKFAWRCSVFVGVTVADHLWGLHMRMGNEVVCATREQLDAEHPLRLLLKPFCFRTIAINHRASAVLVVNRGLPHRAMAFTYEGLAAALTVGYDRGRLEPFPQMLKRNGTAQLADFPFGEDGTALYGVIRDYCEGHLSLYFADDDSVRADSQLMDWWHDLAPIRRDEGPLQTADQIVDAAASFVFSVVGMHEHVGALNEYLFDPSKLAPRIHPGAVMGDCQGSILVMMLVAGTGLAQPALLSDFDHLLPKPRRAEAKAVLDRFMADLRALSESIDARNTASEHPYNSFNPTYLECSVSI